MSDLISEPRKATWRGEAIAHQICRGWKEAISYRETGLVKMVMLLSLRWKHSLDTSRNDIWNAQRTEHFLPSSSLTIVILCIAVQRGHSIWTHHCGVQAMLHRHLQANKSPGISAQMTRWGCQGTVNRPHPHWHPALPFEMSWNTSHLQETILCVFRGEETGHEIRPKKKT